MPGLILWKNPHISRLKKDIDTMFARPGGVQHRVRPSIIRRMPSLMKEW
jgi:hypothetical protein